jgi:PhnB protein
MMKTTTLHSYISFNGNAAEAIDFYKAVFDATVTSNTFGEFAESMPSEPEDANKIMHAFIKNEHGVEFMLSDTPSSMTYSDGKRVVLSLSGDDEVMLRQYWDRLIEGGTIDVPFEMAPWGDAYGALTDKFGVGWMINVGAAE